MVTIFEGYIDPTHLPTLTTHLRINNKEYIILNPKFEESEGKAKMTLKLSTQIKTDKITVTGNTTNELDGKGSLALHV